MISALTIPAVLDPFMPGVPQLNKMSRAINVSFSHRSEGIASLVTVPCTVRTVARFRGISTATASASGSVEGIAMTLPGRPPQVMPAAMNKCLFVVIAYSASRTAITVFRAACEEGSPDSVAVWAERSTLLAASVGTEVIAFSTRVA